MSEKKKGIFKSFPVTYWIAIMMEFFERGSYYGVMSILSIYMTEKLGFAKENVGLIKGTIQPILYFLPIVSGALADRFGYRKTLLVAFTFLSGGYLLASQMTAYGALFLALCVMAIGAGTFKPVISGTIARVTDENTSTLGFGIFYWTINLGAFLFPLFLVPFLKEVDPTWSWVMIAAAIGTGIMILPTIFLYKQPPMPEDKNKKDLMQTVANAFEIIYSPVVLLFVKGKKLAQSAAIIYGLSLLVLVLGIYNFAVNGSFMLLFVMLLVFGSYFVMNVTSRNMKKTPAQIALFVIIGLVLWLLPGLSLFARILSSIIYMTVFSLFKIETDDEAKFIDFFHFLLLIVIYSGFWVLYFQMFDSVLWYVKDYVDAAQLDTAVNKVFAFFGLSYQWHFDVEHVTVINAGTIILLQLIVSAIVKNTKALPTMMTGIGIATVGMAVLAVSPGIWVFMLGIVLFSIGEMSAHPKFISYVGQTAPKERLATYMGYIFLYGVIGSSVGAVVGAKLYVHFVDNLQQPRTLWLIFAMIGVATIIGLTLYNKFIAKGNK
ncbi:MAG: MFS transporter [Candidatus Marinimicrobia bacterium]|nr:MFS transporter [Candidatus Neomarinimicrobiota bacterium]